MVDDDPRGISPYDLILRAMEEDHAALRAVHPEAQIAHRRLAELMRARADAMLASGIRGDERVRSDGPGK